MVKFFEEWIAVPAEISCWTMGIRWVVDFGLQYDCGSNLDHWIRYTQNASDRNLQWCILYTHSINNEGNLWRIARSDHLAPGL